MLRRRDGGLHDRGHDPERIRRSVSVVHERRHRAIRRIRRPMTFSNRPRTISATTIFNRSAASGARDEQSGVVSWQWSVVSCRRGGAVVSRRGGFTLIELLVVILIILIVSAVALAGGFAGALAPTGERGGASASRCARRCAGFGAQERDTERHPFAARPGVSAGFLTPTTGLDRPDPAAGGQPHHPDRSGARVFGRDAVVSRLRSITFNIALPADQRWRNLPVRPGQPRNDCQRSHGQGAGDLQFGNGNDS